MQNKLRKQKSYSIFDMFSSEIGFENAYNILLTVTRRFFFCGSFMYFCLLCLCLFVLILYVPSTIFQLNRNGFSWVDLVLSKDKCVLLKDHNAVTPVRLKPAALRSRVKHSTTTPLRSHLCLCARLFICALWSPPVKGLTSWVSFVVCNCEFVTFQLVSWGMCCT